MKLFILTFVAAFLSCLCFNAFAQTGSTGTGVILDTYTITITNKPGETVLGNPTNGLNISVIPGGKGVGALTKGVTFMANGATTLLTAVNTTNNIISVAWDGFVIDGKIIIVGMLLPGETVSDNFLVTKVEQSGGADITSKTNINIALSSSLPPPQVDEDDIDDKNDPNKEDENKPVDKPVDKPDDEFEDLNEPEITISGPELIQLADKKSIITEFQIEGAGFTSSVRCFVESSDKFILKIKPKRFILNQRRMNKTIFTKILKKAAKKILQKDLEEIITLDASCDNGAFDSFDILISP